MLCIGASHWDVIGRTGEDLSVGDDVAGRIEHRPGGVASNVALGLARHGCPVGLCSAVGGDVAGTALIRNLEAVGVDCTNVLQIEDRTTDHYIAIEDKRGDLFAAVADAAVLEAASDAVTRKAKRALGSCQSIFFEANLPTPALQQIASASISAGTRIVANPVSPAKASRLAFLLTGAFAPTLVTNLAEANVLLAGAFESTLDAAKALQDRTSGTALVTDGARPAALVTADHAVGATPPRLPGNASVTGAGDALLSAFLAMSDQLQSPDQALQHALHAAGEHMKENIVI